MIKNKSVHCTLFSLKNKVILKKEGLREANIIDSGICTKSEKNKMLSYREDKEKAGRNTERDAGCFTKCFYAYN